MKKKALIWGPIVQIVLILAVIIIGYIFIVGQTSRLGPILGRLGLIDGNESPTEQRQAPPLEQKLLVEQAIGKINEGITMCRDSFENAASCTCDIDVPNFPAEYIIRIIDTAAGSFMAGYKADPDNDQDIPPAEMIAPITIPIEPCFSDTLYDPLVQESTYAQLDARQAIGLLHPIREPFFNLARMESGLGQNLFAIVPERFADGSAACVFEGGANTRTTMQYHVLGPEQNNNNKFSILRSDNNHLCFITDREDDVDACDANVDEATTQQYYPAVNHLFKCGETSTRPPLPVPPSVLPPPDPARPPGRTDVQY